MIDPAVTVIADGAVEVEALQLTSIAARALGIALNPKDAKTNIGAGVGFTYLSVANTADIGAGARIAADGIRITAGTPIDESTGEAELNSVIVWGLAAAGGKSNPQIAGSVGLTVISYTTTAHVEAGADLNSAGALSITASNPMGLQNLAIAGALSQGGAAVGAAIAINILEPVRTTATVDSSTATPTRLDAAGAMTIRSTAALGLLGVDVGLMGSNLLGALEGIPGVSLIPAPGSQVASPAVSTIAVAGGAGTGELSLGGSFIVNVWSRTTTATIGAGALINQRRAGTAAQTVTVLARDDTEQVEIAGALGLSTGDAGIGIAVIVDVVDTTVTASFGSSSRVSAGET
ncbi:hypothetical protein [Microbacterium elymi]|uniref:Uncharacterized protein n=1 Tax=Microbacterium elymi TaxID=2909587 RepID=A0ABY5NL85_9MICO|nr:hypothetical protein [Microbacterium elymi]UUT35879.1 hypothetical protein L2X98_22235 [Microbacterium elymi]